MKTLKNQKGLALVSALLLLIVITIVAVSGMQSSIMQEKMVTATRDSNVALEGAEHALREAENIINVFKTTGSFNNTGCLYTQGSAPANMFDPAVWTTAKSCPINYSGTELAHAPRYFIELSGELQSNTAAAVNVGNYGDLQAGSKVTAFRIVARSTGATGLSQRFVAIYYGKVM
jgi:type IV pilus assembly protein PilX